jgi:signal transduction histidine kinase/HAMP domain-containing protein
VVFPSRVLGHLSLRSKTILGIALIEGALLTVLIYSSMHFMQNASNTQLQDYVRLTRGSMIGMTQDAVLSMDLARLQSFAESTQDAPGIVYTRILGADNSVLAQRGLPQAPFRADTSLDSVDDGVFDLDGEIKVDGTRFGRIETGIDVSYLQGLVAQARWSSFAVASVEMLLVALFSFMLGTYLTRQLKHLCDAAQRISKGELGYQVPVSGDDELAKTSRVFNDMSSQLRANAALHERHDQDMMAMILRFDTVLDLSPDGYVHMDEAGVITHLNPAYERITGQPLTSLLGKKKDDLIAQLQALADPAHAFPLTQRYFQSAWSVLHAGHLTDAVAAEANLSVSLYLSLPMLKVLECNLRVNPDDRSVVLYMHDVTRLTELDRMKSEFLATAAHELRTPIASIVGFSELLLNHHFDAAMTQDSLETINRQAKNLTLMLNDLLDLARIEARTANMLNLAPLEVSELIRECINSASMGQEKHTLRLELRNGLPMVMADRAQIRRVVMNLLSNAFKYSPDGGEVTVWVYREIKPDGSPHVCVSVSDQGIGMTQAQIARVFERFYRADASGHIPGSGLGMSITKEIIDMHGGEIELDSVPAQGTTVTIRLKAEAVMAEVLAA